MSFAAKIAKYIRKHGLMAPGERVGVAVSGGADSVAMLRALLELRAELGCMLAVVHFNHKMRPDADSDAEFVGRLAKEHGLQFFGGSGEARGYAAEHRMSLETAARELRYGFFAELQLDKVATAHTLDDQAETVLMKVLRGAGTKGLSGIWPCVRRQDVGGRRQERQSPRHGPSTAPAAAGFARDDNSAIIRPMLGVRRREVETYLRDLRQEWREDASNRDVKHTRNKVRHELLPLLEREYNPNIYQQLADAAEVARAEEEYWAEAVSTQYSVPSTQEKQVPRSARDDNQDQTQGPSTRAKAGRSLGMTNVGDSNGAETRHAASLRDDVWLSLDVLGGQPLAVKRRVLRQCFERVTGKSLDFEHTDDLVRFVERRQSSRLQLPEYWFAVLDWPARALRFEERVPIRKLGTSGGKTPSNSVSKKGGKLTGRKV